MRKTDYTEALDTVTFKCPWPCLTTFSAPPERVEPLAEQEHHPWRYVAACPECGREAHQAPWEVSLLKAWQHQTGPTTPEGIAKVTANLAGHPTPEEAKRTRFNRLKHGLNARVAQYFPARPGKYPACTGCEVAHDWCARQAACTKQTQLFMLHHAAFETRNPKALQGIYADMQAAVFATVQQILQTILHDGAKVETPQWYIDKESGQLVIAEYVDNDGNRRVLTEIQAHPLFKPLGELLSRNNLSLSDMGVTAKVIDEQEQDLGRLQTESETREALTEYSARQAKALEDLRGLLERAGSRRDADPVLIEYQQQNGGGA